MDEVLKKIQSLGLMAVIRASGPQEVERIVEALVAGGVTGIEVTFTTPDALEAVEDLADQYGDRIVLGMGTLTRPEHARQAREVGAQFLVSPHIEEELALYDGRADTHRDCSGLPLGLPGGESFSWFSGWPGLFEIPPGSLSRGCCDAYRWR